MHIASFQDGVAPLPDLEYAKGTGTELGLFPRFDVRSLNGTLSSSE